MKKGFLVEYVGVIIIAITGLLLCGWLVIRHFSYINSRYRGKNYRYEVVVRCFEGKIKSYEIDGDYYRFHLENPYKSFDSYENHEGKTNLLSMKRFKWNQDERNKYKKYCSDNLSYTNHVFFTTLYCKDVYYNSDLIGTTIRGYEIRLMRWYPYVGHNGEYGGYGDLINYDTELWKIENGKENGLFFGWYK